MTIDVALIAPVRAYRDALATAIAEVAGIRLVGQAATSTEAMPRPGADQPSVALIDLGHHDAISAIHDVRAVAPSARLVAFGVGSTAQQCEAVIHAAELGVTGFIENHQPLADILDAVRQAIHGHASCSPRIVGLLLQALQRGSVHLDGSVSGTRGGANVLLTPRERLVSELAARGLTNRQIASHLNLGESTVKTHMHAILGKLGLSSRDELVVIPPPRTPAD